MVCNDLKIMKLEINHIKEKTMNWDMLVEGGVLLGSGWRRCGAEVLMH